MIQSQIYGGGHRWYCTECDRRENEYGLRIISWTNSTPPSTCGRCAAPSTPGPDGDITPYVASCHLDSQHGRPAHVGSYRWLGIVKHITTCL